MGLYRFKTEDAEGFARHVGIPVRRKGDELIFKKCPFCGMNSNDKEKFSINLTTGKFHCFRASCDAKGNMITLSKEFNYSLNYDVDEYYREMKQYRKFKVKEKPVPKPAAVTYLQGRGISEEVAAKYHITTQRDHENVLVFPFYDEHGVLTFIKYRKTDFDKEKDSCKEWCEADCKTILFGMDQCDMSSDTLVLTEGQIDSLSLATAGIANVVSVPTGAKGFTWIPHCWDFLGKFERLIVFGDYEKGKITLLEEMHARFHGQVLHVREQDYRGCKDANEILMKHGPEALQNAVENAVPVLMIHNPMTVAFGDSKEMEKAIEMLKSVKDSIVNAYEIKTGLSRTKISHLMDAETWMDSGKAIELGFADGLMQRKGAAEDVEIPQVSMLYSKTTVMNCLMEKIAEKCRIQQKETIEDTNKVKVDSLMSRLNLLKTWR